MSYESADKPQSFPDRYPNWCRASGVLPLIPLTLGIVIFAPVLGPVVATLAGTAAGALLGAYFTWTQERAPLFPGGKVERSPEEIKKSVRGGSVLGGAAFGILALSFSLAGQWGAAQERRIDALPEIDPHTIVETKEIKLHERVCKRGAAGRQVEVTHDGQQYRLLCPK